MVTQHSGPHISDSRGRRHRRGVVIHHGESPSANVIGSMNENREHSQPAFEVAHLAAGADFCPYLSLFLLPQPHRMLL